MTRRVAVLSILTAVIGLCGAGARAEEHHAALLALAKGVIRDIAAYEMVVEAVIAHNTRTAGYDAARIAALDAQWQAEMMTGNLELIDAVLTNDLSAFLSDTQRASNGLFTEIFVMDARGLNVGQSAATSDYWQGDEAKWRKTFLVGPGAVHLGPMRRDPSTGALQIHVSTAIVDPATGRPIGAITFGVAASRL